MDEKTTTLTDSRDMPAGGILVVYVLVLTGVMTNYGGFDWRGLAMMVAALALALLLHVRPMGCSIPVEGMLLGIVATSLWAMWFLRTGQAETRVTYQLTGYAGLQRRINAWGFVIRALAGVGLVACLSYLVRGVNRRRGLAVTRLVVLVLIAVSVRGMMLKSSPRPPIDVIVSQTLGARGLLLELKSKEARDAELKRLATEGRLPRTLAESRNVYAMKFPPPHRRAQAFDHYAYPPTTLYANAVSWALFKDVRVVWILCDLLGALFLSLVACRMAPGEGLRRYRELLVLAFLFMPRSLFVIEQSWTEPLVVATMGGFAWMVSRRSNVFARGVAMALWFTSKQYVALAAPFVLRLRKCSWRVWAVAGVVGVALFAPMALWDWGEMYHDLFGFFLTSSARPDALSIVGAVKRFGHEIPGVVTAILTLAGLGLLTWRMRRSVAGMLFGTATAWLLFFLLGKQAFMNYWYLVLVTLLMAVAATPPASADEAE